MFLLLSNQGQPLKGVLVNIFSENMQQINRRTPMQKCDLNKVAKQICSIFSEHPFTRAPLGDCFDPISFDFFTALQD